MKRIDLHSHSTFSDGSLTPTQLIDRAYEKGISAIALTDHDTIDGLLEGQITARKHDIELINGIELSANFMGREVHILGYFLDETSKILIDNLKELSSKRIDRNLKMLKKMQDESININISDFDRDPLKSQITRAHFAKALCKKGYCKNFDEAFKKYLTVGTKTYIPKAELSPVKCMDIIHEASGITALAHPFLYKLEKDEIDKLVKSLKELGLDAIETVYSTNTIDQELFTRNLAKKYNLNITGGSDFHGDMKPNIELGMGFGGLFIGYNILEDLRRL